jgi:hypothetical protein
MILISSGVGGLTKPMRIWTRSGPWLELSVRVARSSSAATDAANLKSFIDLITLTFLEPVCGLITGDYHKLRSAATRNATISTIHMIQRKCPIKIRARDQSRARIESLLAFRRRDELNRPALVFNESEDISRHRAHVFLKQMNQLFLPGKRTTTTDPA